MHTTNYYNTFIEVAEDCPAKEGQVPVQRGEKSAANLQYEILTDYPYQYTSDDILFQVYALKNKISKSAMTAERDKFFSKGQPCFRASPLTKRYGWGVHSDEKGRMAIFGKETAEYKKLTADKKLDHKKAMRSKKA